MIHFRFGFLLVALTFGCSGTTTEDDDSLITDPSLPLKNPDDPQDIRTAPYRSFGIDQSGSHYTFMATQEPYPEDLRAYGSTADEPAPFPLTNGSHGAEVDSLLSADGQWVAIITYHEGKNKIILQAFGDPENVALVHETTDSITGLAFSPEAAPKLAIMMSTSNKTSIKVFSVDAQEGRLTISGRQSIDDLAFGETGLSWFKNDESIGLITKSPSTNSPSFQWRGQNDDGTFATATRIGSDKVKRVLNKDFAVGDSAIAYIAATGGDQVRITSESDKESPRKVSVEHEVVILPIGNAEIAKLPSLQTTIKQVEMAGASSLLVSLGYETFDCQAAGDGWFTGTSLLFFDGVNSSKALVKIHDQGLELVTENYCQAFQEGKAWNEQSVDLRLKEIALSPLFEDRSINMLLKSGKGEIYRLHLQWESDGLELVEGRVAFR